ncbi:MAG: LacI family DNA-binding transcriptional regulator [Verrucomicrobia bacterium]|nr:LacI family DNA-binding transcriptional regulator [Verrucomicrobiota bacterium]MCH8525624.1 LacI family transcriptional regulator [Kiritimatiellia bacterium]
MAKVTAVNVREIAAKAGVSHITVSRALRDAPNVSAETKARVREVAERMGYRPNPLVAAYAAQIRRGKGSAPDCNLAWLGSELTPGHKDFAWIRPYREGVAARAKELGFALETHLDTEKLSSKRLGSLLAARGIRGVIVPHIRYKGPELTDLNGIARVGIGPTPSATPMHTVTPDHFTNMTTAFSHLLALGHKRIGFCEHLQGAVSNQGTLWGSFLFNQQRVAKKNRVPPLTGLYVANTHKEAEARFRAWFRKEKPDAVLCTFVHVRDWLTEETRVPEDTGLAHSALAEDTPGWSGIDVLPHQLGSAAVDLLAAHIQRNEYGIPDIPKLMRVPGRWRDGNSTRLPEGGTDPRVDPPSHNHSLDWFQHEFGMNS